MVRVLFVNFFLQQNRINLITSVPMIVGKLGVSNSYICTFPVISYRKGTQRKAAWGWGGLNQAKAFKNKERPNRSAFA